jgi:hypothetical protein
MTPKELTESALVTQAVKAALTGTERVIEEIMNEPSLEYPKWWFSIKSA